MSVRIAAAAAAAIVLLAGPAMAQSCVSDPNNRCTVRFANDPNAWIPRLVSGFGGVIVCDGIPASTVQYDKYKWSGGFVYDCSTTVACSAIQSSDPQAYAKFCP